MATTSNDKTTSKTSTTTDPRTGAKTDSKSTQTPDATARDQASTPDQGTNQGVAGGPAKTQYGQMSVEFDPNGKTVNLTGANGERISMDISDFDAMVKANKDSSGARPSGAAPTVR